MTPTGRSDIAYRVLEYVLADPAARAWLDGEPDEAGMVVNPWYSTNPEVNPTGAALTLPNDGFPKADPDREARRDEDRPRDGTGPISLVGWRPYTHNFADGAYHVLRGDGMILGEWDELVAAEVR